MLESRPRLSGPRLAAGAFAGAAGGLAFALLITAQLLRGPYAPDGMAGMIATVLRTDNPLAVWGTHLAAATVFGLVFSAVVAPWHPARTIPLAVGFGVLLWLFAGFLALHALAGVPLALTRSALFDLAGHVVFGLVLGAVYVAFFRVEGKAARERATASSPNAPVRRA
ncbi:MAG: hypothetical protein QOE90_1366 [Thermoplasmata archaeon]|jgi:hypothetical protein|nr:hypothetical protein [Thermoplasmata archaeon]